MPTYDYRCPRCGVVVELMHGMAENPKPTCACDGQGLPVDMQRVILQAPGFQLKGDGWFKDGYS